MVKNVKIKILYVIMKGYVKKTQINQKVIFVNITNIEKKIIYMVKTNIQKR